MDYANPTKIWWPHPSAFDDLTVTDTEDGFILDAPDGTECGDWLKYFSETPERQMVFQEEFTKMLLEQINFLESHKAENDGKAEVVPDKPKRSRRRRKEDGPGEVKEHKPRRNRKKRTQEEVQGPG